MWLSVLECLLGQFHNSWSCPFLSNAGNTLQRRGSSTAWVVFIYLDTSFKLAKQLQIRPNTMLHIAFLFYNETIILKIEQ